MITLQELCSYLDELLDVQSYTDYCFNGLQVEGTKTINKFATAVTASLATIQAAVDLGVQALIVHHGMFWNGDSYVISDTKREKLRLLLKYDISLLAYHLPLDAHQELGNNWKAAMDMNWKGLESFGELHGRMMGVKGRLSSMSVSDFQEKLEDYYKHQAHCALGGKDTIETVALISGGAYKMITEASKEKIDCYITGNFDEPAWHHAYEEHINFFAMGHSATEKVGPQAIGNHLQNRFDLKYSFVDIPNPF